MRQVWDNAAQTGNRAKYIHAENRIHIAGLFDTLKLRIKGDDMILSQKNPLKSLFFNNSSLRQSIENADKLDAYSKLCTKFAGRKINAFEEAYTKFRALFHRQGTFYNV